MTRYRGFPLAGAFALAIVLAAARSAGAAPAQESSGWAEGTRSGARLIAAGALLPGQPRPLLAGVEIRLKPRFITYWRDPGDAGVPPTFDFAGSANLASAEIRYPAPGKLDEAGGTAFGYRDHVVFPLVLVPVDAAKPILLRLSLDYAACHDVCLPVHADLALSVGADPAPEAASVRAAYAAVPRREELGGPGPVRILAATPNRDGFSVETEPGGNDAALFVEAPEGWAYAVGAGSPGPDGRVVFPVKQLEAAKDTTVPRRPVVLTLVSPAGAVEVPVQLDAAAVNR